MFHLEWDKKRQGLDTIWSTADDLSVVHMKAETHVKLSSRKQKERLEAFFILADVSEAFF